MNQKNGSGGTWGEFGEEREMEEIMQLNYYFKNITKEQRQSDPFS